MFAQQLPGLLFALSGGVLVDRLPRRALIAAVNVTRAATLGGLALLIAGGESPLSIIYIVLFLLGTGETLADTDQVA